MNLDLIDIVVVAVSIFAAWITVAMLVAWFIRTVAFFMDDF